MAIETASKIIMAPAMLLGLIVVKDGEATCRQPQTVVQLQRLQAKGSPQHA